MALSLRASTSLRKLLSRAPRVLSMTALSSTRSIHTINDYHNHVRWHNESQPKTYNNIFRHQTRFATTKTAEVTEDGLDVKGELDLMNQKFAEFEHSCSHYERAEEVDLARVFNHLTKAVEAVGPPNEENANTYANISLIASSLLRSCGKLMVDSTEKARELLAGNVWQFIKEKQIPISTSHYNSLIRALNENNSSYDPQKMLDEMASANLTPDQVTYQRLIEQYCLQGNIQEATKLLEVMKEQQLELNEKIFANLIIGYNKQPEPPAMSELFGLMRSNGVEPGNKSYTAAIISKAETIEKNENALKDLKELLHLVKDEEINFTNMQICDILTCLTPLKDKLELIDDILGNAENCMRGSINDRYRILSTLLKIGHHEVASNLFWKQRVSTRALQGGRVGFYYLEALARFDVPIDFIANECDRFKMEGFCDDPFTIIYLKSVRHGKLDKVRMCLRVLNQENRARVPHYWPLIAQARTEQEVFNVLKNDLNPSMNKLDLIETFSHWVLPKLNGDFEKLLETNQKELRYDSSVLTTAYLDYSVTENKLEEALKYIEKIQGAEIIITEPTTEEVDERQASVSRRPIRSSFVQRILTRIAEVNNDPNLVVKAFELLHLPPETVTNACLTPVIEAYLQNNDFKGALDKFLLFSGQYKKTPLSRDLMTICLNNKDPESLQKIIHACTTLHGEPNALLDLAMCCLRNKKLHQAQKIFSSPGLRVRPERIFAIAEGLAKSKDVDMLENFVELVRDIYGVDTDRLYEILINYYDSTSHASRALRLWNTMQDEDLQPSRRIMQKIANLLEKNNIAVPFKYVPRPSNMAR